MKGWRDVLMTWRSEGNNSSIHGSSSKTLTDVTSVECPFVIGSMGKLDMVTPRHQSHYKGTRNCKIHRHESLSLSALSISEVDVTDE